MQYYLAKIDTQERTSTLLLYVTAESIWANLINKIWRTPYMPVLMVRNLLKTVQTLQTWACSISNCQLPATSYKFTKLQVHLMMMSSQNALIKMMLLSKAEKCWQYFCSNKYFCSHIIILYSFNPLVASFR